MTELPILVERLGADGLEELRRLIAEEVSRRLGSVPAPPPARPSVPGPDEDLRPRS